MFNYQVMSESEAQQERFQLLKEGTYNAYIEKSEDRVSSTGNPMMDITLSVYDNDGRPHTVRDFLVFTKGMMWKVIGFANSAGIYKEYEDGALCSEVALGHKVRVKIGIEQGSIIPNDKLKDKVPGARYPDKNKVAEYLMREDAQEQIKNDLDDDIPF